MSANSPPEPPSAGRTDPIGVAASSLCAVHCVLCAALPGVLSVMGLEVLFGPSVEWGFTIVAIAFASMSLGFGWRHHRSPWIAAALLFGMTALLASRLLEDHHEPAAHADADHEAETGHHHGHESEGHDDGHVFGAWLGTLGGLVLVGGHLSTIRASRRRDPCCD